MSDAMHVDRSGQAAPDAGVCTVPADLAQRLDALLRDVDNLRSLHERHHAFMVHALTAHPGTDAARHHAYRAWASIEAADLAADAALRLLTDALRCCGVVVDVPDSDEPAADAGACEHEGGKS